MKEIVLTTINAKWIHPSLALRLLKANLGFLEDSCEIIEFALRQPLSEKLEPFLNAVAPNGRPRILGISVSIWNHLATIELLEELNKIWLDEKPVIVLGGPEVSHLPPDADIFSFAGYVIRGEGEIAFRLLCEEILLSKSHLALRTRPKALICNEPDIMTEIKSAYHLYTDEDLAKKLIYAEASRGCPFKCEFCLSAISGGKVREFPLEQFLSEMDKLIQRGAGTFKFLDRSININIPRLMQICGFFLDKIDNPSVPQDIIVHFEMVPSLFPPDLCETLARFPAGALRLEIGIQTLNQRAAERIGRRLNPSRELEALRFLREKTNAVIHADLIAGLPGEDIKSFGKGFDQLWEALWDARREKHPRTEIQLGILKQLPGTLISHHNKKFCMRYNPLPPYEIEETGSISAEEMRRLKNFARFWEILINRGLIKLEKEQIFEKFMALSDELLAYFGRNWGIDRNELLEKVNSIGICS